MALDSKLMCATSASDAEICDLIARRCGIAPAAEAGYLRYRAPGLWGTVMAATDLSVELTKEAFGFVPTKTFLFRLDKFNEIDVGLAKMAELCAAIMRELATDCVFFTEDTPILLRRSKHLTLKPSEDDPARKKLLDLLTAGAPEPKSVEQLPEW